MTQRLNAIRAAIQADPARRHRVARLERHYRRLAIARRRERIAAQPQVGDQWSQTVGSGLWHSRVTSVDADYVYYDWTALGGTMQCVASRSHWAADVRRQAAWTQEGSEP